MINLPATYIQAKNALSGSGAWVLLMQLSIDESNVLRIAANQNANITWNGYNWQWFPVEPGDIKEGKDKVNRLDIKVCNVNRAVQSQIEAFGGGVDCQVTWYLVHSGNLGETTVPQWSFLIEEVKANALWVTFTLGPKYKIDTMRDPVDKMYKNFCRFNFPHSVDSRCPYADTGFTTCNRTLSDCQERNGSDAYLFGGFPAIGKNTLYV